MDDQEKQQLTMVHRAVFGFIDPATNAWVKGLVQTNAEMNERVTTMSESIVARLGRLERIGLVVGIAVSLGTNINTIKDIFNFVAALLPK